jgi:DNA-binding NarL/FixJ family response regulator
MIRLYYIDDHCIITAGFSALCKAEKSDITVAGTSKSISKAMTDISPDLIDIIILDLHLPDSKPVDNLKALRDKFPEIPVIICSCDSSVAWQIAMFMHGARAYVNKTYEMNVIFDRIHQVASGETVIPAGMPGILFTGVSAWQEAALPDEFLDILLCLSHGLNNKEIGDKLNLTESAVSKKLKTIHACFRVKTNCELVNKVLTGQIPF